MLHHAVRPLCRWTVGPTHSRGLDILRQSVKNFRMLYPEFDLKICYNQIDKIDMDMDIELYHQSGIELDISPIYGDAWNGPCWKLYPPRMRIESHELVIDNDLVIYKRIPEIDLFLQSNNRALILEARYRNYGQFGHLVGDLKLNSGLYGMPPYYDLEHQIQQMDIDKWAIRGDDQGLLAANLQNVDPIIITTQRIMPLDDKHDLLISGIGGAHFIHANTAIKHKAWELYENYRSYDDSTASYGCGTSY